MDEMKYLKEATEKHQLQKVLEVNQKTEKFGLTLTEDDAKYLLQARQQELKRQQRVEFGEGILSKLIYFFCDSSFISQDNFVETMERMQEIFYIFKNESMDALTDDELLQFMREQYEEICFGDLEYLESTCLENFSQAIRKGYRGYQKSQGSGEYEHIDEVTRWDRKLYEEALIDLF